MILCGWRPLSTNSSYIYLFFWWTRNAVLAEEENPTAQTSQQLLEYLHVNLVSTQKVTAKDSVLGCGQEIWHTWATLELCLQSRFWSGVTESVWDAVWKYKNHSSCGCFWHCMAPCRHGKLAVNLVWDVQHGASARQSWGLGERPSHEVACKPALGLGNLQVLHKIFRLWNIVLTEAVRIKSLSYVFDIQKRCVFPGGWRVDGQDIVWEEAASLMKLSQQCKWSMLLSFPTLVHFTYSDSSRRDSVSRSMGAFWEKGDRVRKCCWFWLCCI